MYPFDNARAVARTEHDTSTGKKVVERSQSHKKPHTQSNEQVT